MTPELFLTLAASCAIAILLVVELRVPVAPIRRWAQTGPQVVSERDEGPWVVRRLDPDTRQWHRDPEAHPSPSAAAAHLTAAERFRAWLGELMECPYCTGAWLTAAALGVAAVDRGADVLVYWPALWFTSAVLVVTARRIGEA